MTSLLLSRLHFPIHNLGYGCRAGIWFQGCTVYCRGCVSRDTWPFDPARRSSVEDVLAWVHALPAGTLDGITLSGGEPTDQPGALRELLAGLNDWRNGYDRPVDILMYSGRSAGQLDRQFGWLAGAIDVLVSEPFVAARATECALRGSANQIVRTCTDLGRDRYPDYLLEDDYQDQRRSLAVHVDDRAVWMVGIPLPGDLRRLEHDLTARGIDLTRTSWLM